MSLIVKHHVPHLDSLMKLFVLSLEDDALDWFTSLPDCSIRDKNQLENAFMEKWGEHKDNKYLLAALTNAKRK
jgi:hypothetical protein